MSFADKIAARGPKRLLALDGGGLRGLISIEVLAAIERAVGMRLCDYFDYVAGTSAGAILATCLSAGMSVDEIRRFFLEAGAEMFERARLFRRHLHKYSDERLAALLRSVLVFPRASNVEMTLGSAGLETLLLLVLRNATTDSPWPLSNNPRALFNDRSLEDCNLDLPLWRLVRASTAAPTYFPPENIRLGSKEFLFVDGGVTPYNNPAFLLFLHATLAPYRLCWPTGCSNLLVVSVGTGSRTRAKASLVAAEMNLLYNATTIPGALMSAAAVQQDTLCRIFGSCLHGAPIDLEIGDLHASAASDGLGLPKLFTYVRYDADLSREGLDHLGLPAIIPASVQTIDALDHMEDLRHVGIAAGHEVRHEHFTGFAPLEELPDLDGSSR